MAATEAVMLQTAASAPEREGVSGRLSPELWEVSTVTFRSNSMLTDPPGVTPEEEPPSEEPAEFPSGGDCTPVGRTGLGLGLGLGLCTEGHESSTSVDLWTRSPRAILIAAVQLTIIEIVKRSIFWDHLELADAITAVAVIVIIVLGAASIAIRALHREDFYFLGKNESDFGDIISPC
jgi:hypothetical protein